MNKLHNLNCLSKDNFAGLRPTLFVLPVAVLLAVVGFLFAHNALSPNAYVDIQSDVFFALNAKLSQYPTLQDNLTQMGNAMIFMSFLTIFILYAPSMWRALLPASLISGIISRLLKGAFGVPRPATVFDHDTFTIVGEQIHGYASCPSGHSITIFTTLTVVMFAFMPKELRNRLIWCFVIVLIGLLLASSRVGVGAHHPLDVIIGSTLGYLSGLLGIFVDRRFPVLFGWVENRKVLPIFLLTFIGFAIAVINKILQTHLIVFYLSLISLIISLYAITKTYISEIKR